MRVLLNESTETLRNLLLECKSISNLNAPREAKISDTLRILMENDKGYFEDWIDMFYSAQNSIEREILIRFRLNTL